MANVHCATRVFTHKVSLSSTLLRAPSKAAMTVVLLCCCCLVVTLFASTLFVQGHVTRATTTTTAAGGATKATIPAALGQDHRDLQSSSSESTLYTASYRAEFQVLRDPLCVNDDPTVLISCFGSSSSDNIVLRNVSHPGIVTCGTTAELDEIGRWTITCTTSCSAAAAATTNSNSSAPPETCEDAFLAIDGNSNQGPFATIDFDCTSGVGESPSSTTGSVTVLGSPNGACAQSGLDSRLFYLARLGVSCPNSTAMATNDQQRDYVFDDFYFECLGGFALQNKIADPRQKVPDQYTCADGSNCGGAACTIEIDDVVVVATVSNFQEQCLQPTVSTTLSPTPVPNSDNALENAFLFVARFATAWGLLFDAVNGDDCMGSTPTVRVSCPNSHDIAVIAVNTTDTINCTVIENGVMECVDTNSANFVSQFTSLAYVSTPTHQMDAFGSDTLMEGYSLALLEKNYWFRNVRDHCYRPQPWSF
jgi:hypothetical protein